MPDVRPNPGPRAAAANRRALLAAAREVFAEQGTAAPLSAVARRAGVGQGSLYRHFPDRASLAIAVFEDNVAELEALAAGTTTLDELFAQLTARSIDSAAFVDLIAPTTDDPHLVHLADRVTTALASKLPHARDVGQVHPDTTPDDLSLAIRMIAALLAKTPAEHRADTARAAWHLLERGLAPTVPSPTVPSPVEQDGQRTPGKTR